MQDVDTFLAGLAQSRRLAQAATRAGFVAPPNLSLPHALEIAIKHRWLIQPVEALSESPPSSARIGVPSREKEQIEYWIANHPDANWLLELGEPSGVVALRIELQLARYSLEYLAGDDTSWLRTLRFGVGNRWFALYQYLSGLPALAGLPGLRLLTRTSILSPPSRTPSGIELAYANPHAQLLPFPWQHQTALPRFTL